MKTDVDTALKEIADWYVKNRRELTPPELESILVKHCEDEAQIQKFVKFLETEPGELRFKALLRERKGGNSGEEKPLEIERYHGIIVAVGGINTKSPSLPDWDLSYVEYPVGQMKQYRDAFMKARVKIVQVTDRRIYFEQF